MNRNKGFTVIELMAVVAIVSILSVIAMAAYAGLHLHIAKSVRAWRSPPKPKPLSLGTITTSRMPQNNSQCRLARCRHIRQAFDYIKRLEYRRSSPTAPSSLPSKCPAPGRQQRAATDTGHCEGALCPGPAYHRPVNGINTQPGARQLSRVIHCHIRVATVPPGHCDLLPECAGRHIP